MPHILPFPHANDALDIIYAEHAGKPELKTIFNPFPICIIQQRRQCRHCARETDVSAVNVTYLCTQRLRVKNEGASINKMCALGKRENSALEAREIFICVRGPCAHLYRFGFANGKKNPRGEKSGKLKRAKGKKPLIQIRIDANERNARARTDGSSTPSVSRSFFSRADRSPHAAAGTYIFSRGLSLRARALGCIRAAAASDFPSASFPRFFAFSSFVVVDEMCVDVCGNYTRVKMVF